MNDAQPYIFLTGKRDVIRAFMKLYSTLEFIESKSSQPNWELNVKMRYNRLPDQSVTLIKSISSFMGY